MASLSECVVLISWAALRCRFAAAPVAFELESSFCASMAPTAEAALSAAPLASPTSSAALTMELSTSAPTSRVVSEHLPPSTLSRADMSCRPLPASCTALGAAWTMRLMMSVRSRIFAARAASEALALAVAVLLLVSPVASAASVSIVIGASNERAPTPEAVSRTFNVSVSERTMPSAPPESPTADLPRASVSRELERRKSSTIGPTVNDCIAMLLAPCTSNAVATTLQLPSAGNQLTDVETERLPIDIWGKVGSGLWAEKLNSSGRSSGSSIQLVVVISTVVVSAIAGARYRSTTAPPQGGRFITIVLAASM